MAMNFGFSPAGQALGLGGGGAQNLGTDLQDQVIDETDELRKKRLLQQQQNALLGVSGGSAAGQSLGLGSMFGSMTSTGLLR